MKRTLIENTTEKVGEKVKLNGWVASHRVMGKMAFFDLRDRTATVQCVFLSETMNDELWSVVKSVTVESVVEIVGEVKARPERQVNKDSKTGTVEVEVKDIKILNKAAPLPIPVEGDGKDINEESRLKYRYLDLRRERMQKLLRLRAKFTKAVRDAFYEKDFIEVETPILTASTKEGARDFVVPSRIHPGKFYALPQSPQQYKQLLMSAGVENYFQIARCIRDEDLRADRGFEHSQIDIETSFRDQNDIHELVEEILRHAVSAVGGKIREGSFAKYSYAEVIEKFGDDKFDIRTEEEKKDGTLAFAWVTKYPMFKKVDKEDAAEVQDGKSGWTFTHNPFSGIIEEHWENHLNGENIENIEATQYDLVCNGYEIGSGSIRNYKPELLRATYKIMGYSEAETEESIGHMLKAFELGTPPHGGIALGIERLIMILSGEDSLKETVAFPMTYNGRTAIMQGPSEITEEQLKSFGLRKI